MNLKHAKKTLRKGYKDYLVERSQLKMDGKRDHLLRTICFIKSTKCPRIDQNHPELKFET
jgi:hypothetical protein